MSNTAAYAAARSGYNDMPAGKSVSTFCHVNLLQ
jgi:hypothetical protein